MADKIHPNAAKSQLSTTSRRHGRWFSISIWTLSLLLSLLILIAIASTVIFLIYRPHRPSFSLTTFSISTSIFNLSLTAVNPNKKAVKFSYSPFSVVVLAAGVSAGAGEFPSLVQEEKNVTVMKVKVESDGESVSLLKKREIEIEVKVETKVKVEMGWVKLPKIGVRVYCNGITVKKKKVVAVVDAAECKVRMKVWKWSV